MVALVASELAESGGDAAALADALSEEQLRQLCSAGAALCTAGGLFECPITEFARNGCDVEVQRLVECHNDEVLALERLVRNAPSCAELTGPALLEFGMQDRRYVRMSTTETTEFHPGLLRAVSGVR